MRFHLLEINEMYNPLPPDKLRTVCTSWHLFCESFKIFDFISEIFVVCLFSDRVLAVTVLVDLGVVDD